MTAESPSLYRLATIGSPRGLKGEVRLNLHTDDPQGRLGPGEVVATDPDTGDLTIATLIKRDTTWYASFEGRPDRTSVEPLVHTVLLGEGVQEEDAWYADELEGLSVVRTTGEVVGTVVGLEHYPAQDLLVVKETGGQRTLIPLVEEIVPEIDLEAGTVTLDPPHGLLAADGEEE